MVFIIRFKFKSGREKDIFPHRIDHLEYMLTKLPVTLIGGARLQDNDSSLKGLEIVVDLPDRAAAEDLIANEPYNKAGLAETPEIEPLRIMMEEGILRTQLEKERAKAQEAEIKI